MLQSISPTCDTGETFMAVDSVAAPYGNPGASKTQLFLNREVPDRPHGQQLRLKEPAPKGPKMIGVKPAMRTLRLPRDAASGAPNHISDVQPPKGAVQNLELDSEAADG